MNMNTIKQWLARQKEQSNYQKCKEIANCFQVKEKEDTFCIMHNGDAIHDFPTTATIADVIRELNHKRQIALKYAKI